MQEQALIPQYIVLKGNSVFQNMLAVMGGLLLLSLLAQVSIPLPFTPVPITGQTFGVTLVALAWGYRRAVAILGSYLILGSLGLPIFASGGSGFAGATCGYLLGMFIASFVMGFLADLGWTKSFARTLGAAYCGSLIVFTCGLWVLSFYIPKQSLLMAGLYPFLIGDCMKNTLASLIVTKTRPFVFKSLH
jgi:biotin transport system substrate-specific component